MDHEIFTIIWQLLVFFVITSLIILTWYISRKYTYWKERGIPYEKPFLFFGNLKFIMRRSFSDFCYEIGKKHPYDYVGLFMGWQPVLMVQSPELAKRILQIDADHFEDRFLYSGKSDPLGSLNLFTLKNPMWKYVRHELSPMFTSMRLKEIVELMNINAKQLVKKIQRDYIDNNEKVNLKELFSMYTSDTVAYSVFGLRVSILNDQPSPLWTITRHMVKWNLWRGLEFFLIVFVPSLAKILRLNLFSKAASEYIKTLFWNVVEERKTKTSEYKDLINQLLKLNKKIKLSAQSDPELADNLMLANIGIFIFGSIETSSSTLACCLHELAHHPDIQEKLYNEVSDALKKSENDVLDYDELLSLKYLSACAYETLRKYPPVPFLDRVCNKSYQVNENFTIEKGTPVYVNVVGLHHDERLYPEPEEWNPDNMNAVSDGDNRQFTFLPFGEGPRFCIGKRYGMVQVRAALVQVISKFRIEPGPEPYKIQFDPNAVIISPKNGGSVKFIPRQ